MGAVSESCLEKGGDVWPPPPEHYFPMYFYSSNIISVYGGISVSGSMGITEVMLKRRPRIGRREVGGKSGRGIGGGSDGGGRRGIQDERITRRGKCSN